jgi:site-specific DNA-methyltransferase (adenine-specific)
MKATPLSPPVNGGIEEWKRNLAEVTIFGGDARELIKRIPDGAIDCILTDPPFGKDYQSNRRTASEKLPKIVGDESYPQATDLIYQLTDDLIRVMADNSHLYLFCDLELMEEFRNLLDGRNGINFVQHLIWYRGRGTGAIDGSSYVPSWDLVLYFQKGKPKLNGHPANYIHAGRPAKTIWPSQKAVPGLERLLKDSTKPGDLVLDCFAGSGSLGVACQMMEYDDGARKAILMELDPRGVEICRGRTKKI